MNEPKVKSMGKSKQVVSQINKPIRALVQGHDIFDPLRTLFHFASSDNSIK